MWETMDKPGEPDSFLSAKGFRPVDQGPSFVLRCPEAAAPALGTQGGRVQALELSRAFLVISIFLSN